MRNQELISGQFLKRTCLKVQQQSPSQIFRPPLDDNWNSEKKVLIQNQSFTKTTATISEANEAPLNQPIHLTFHALNLLQGLLLNSHCTLTRSYIIQMTRGTQKIHHSGIVLHCCRKHCIRCRLRLHSCKLTEEKQK